MRKIAVLILLVFVIFYAASPLHAANRVYLPDDELILPPFLKTFAGANVLNVRPTNPKLRPHEVKDGEWLDHGDQFDLGPKLGVQILMNENCELVGGGVLRMKVSDLYWNNDESPYRIQLDRGWVKVWVKTPEEATVHRPMRVITAQGEWKSENGVFWALLQAGKTEIYVISGKVVGPGGVILGPHLYSVWDSTGKKRFSRSWGEKALEARVKSLFPHLDTLIESAQKEWERGKIEGIYADLRKKGLAQHSRFDPSQTKKNLQ